jgi:uncharacterized protein
MAPTMNKVFIRNTAPYQSRRMPTFLLLGFVWMVSAPFLSGLHALGHADTQSGQGGSRKENCEYHAVRIRGQVFLVEIAANTATRARGLMHRTELPEQHGMLFVFQDDQYRSFWMKNTPLPLSIAYIDQNGIITDILDMTPFSEEPVPSSRPVRYALELNRNEFARFGIRPGDYVELPEHLR